MFNIQQTNANSNMRNRLSTIDQNDYQNGNQNGNQNDYRNSYQNNQRNMNVRYEQVSQPAIQNNYSNHYKRNANNQQQPRFNQNRNLSRNNQNGNQSRSNQNGSQSRNNQNGNQSRNNQNGNQPMNFQNGNQPRYNQNGNQRRNVQNGKQQNVYVIRPPLSNKQNVYEQSPQNLRAEPKKVLEFQGLVRGKDGRFPNTDSCEKIGFVTVPNDGNDSENSSSCMWMTLELIIRLASRGEKLTKAHFLRDNYGFPNESIQFVIDFTNGKDAKENHNSWIQQVCDDNNLMIDIYTANYTGGIGSVWLGNPAVSFAPKNSKSPISPENRFAIVSYGGHYELIVSKTPTTMSRLDKNTYGAFLLSDLKEYSYVPESANVKHHTENNSFLSFSSDGNEEYSSLDEDETFSFPPQKTNNNYQIPSNYFPLTPVTPVTPNKSNTIVAVDVNKTLDNHIKDIENDMKLMMDGIENFNALLKNDKSGNNTYYDVIDMMIEKNREVVQALQNAYETARDYQMALKMQNSNL